MALPAQSPSGKRYPVRSRIFHAICKDPDPQETTAEYWAGEWWDEHLARDRRFFARMPADLSFEGKTVLDYGCGAGHTSIYAAEHGAKRVLGVDLARVEFAQSQLDERYPQLKEQIEFRQIGSATEIGDERFDLVISKNTMEHVSDPDLYVSDMASLLAPDGRLMIGFSPLWKSPDGGHIGFMTRLPWAHLLFPEQVILRERKRFRPKEDPTRFEEIKGGLNRMTLARFEKVMADSGLEAAYFEVNRNDRKIAKVLNVFSKIPGLKEYFAFSVHSVWRRPAT